jgi:hypothetical protein
MKFLGQEYDSFGNAAEAVKGAIKSQYIGWSSG